VQVGEWAYRAVEPDLGQVEVTTITGIALKIIAGGVSEGLRCKTMYLYRVPQVREVFRWLWLQRQAA